MSTPVSTHLDSNPNKLFIPAALMICILLGLAIAIFSPTLIIALIGFIVMSITLLKKPRLALYSLLLLSPFYFILNSMLTSGQIAGIATNISVLDFLTIAAVAGVCWKYLTSSRDYRGRPSAMDIGCALWLLVAFLALVHGVSQGYEAAFRSARGPLMFVLYFVAAYEMKTEGRLRELSWVLLINSLTIGAMGLLGTAGYLTPFFPGLTVGLVGDSLTLTRPNFFVEPALTIPNIVFLLLSLKFRDVKMRGGRIFTGLAVIGLIANIMLLLLSSTRGFWLGMIAAGFVAIFLLIRYFKIMKVNQTLRIVAYAIVAVIIGEILLRSLFHVSLSEIIMARVGLTESGNDPSTSFRMNELQVYYNSFIESPLIGNGFGSSLPISVNFSSLGFAHNEYIWILQTTGIFGALFFSIFIISGIISGLRQLGQLETINPRSLMIFLLVAVLAGYIVVSFTSAELTNPTTVPLIAILLGVACSKPDELLL